MLERVSTELGYIVVCLQDFYRLKNFVLISHCQTECDEHTAVAKEKRAESEGQKKIHMKLPLPLTYNNHHPLSLASHLMCFITKRERERERARNGKKGRKLAIQSLSSHFKRANRVKSNKNR